MEPNGRGVLAHWEATTGAIRAAMAQGINRALHEHRRLGNPIVTWDYEHERVVIVPPEEIVIPEEVDPEAIRESGPAEGDAGS